MKVKTKAYTFGDLTFKCYYKQVGQGFECGVFSGGKYIFVGNFVYKSEAQTWWKKMCSETSKFCKTYYYSDAHSPAFYRKFYKAFLYKSYYHFLEAAFSKYTTQFTREYGQYKKDYTKHSKDTSYSYSK